MELEACKCAYNTVIELVKVFASTRLPPPPSSVIPLILKYVNDSLTDEESNRGQRAMGTIETVRYVNVNMKLQAATFISVSFHKRAQHPLIPHSSS